MKLYVRSAACSLSPHIIAQELELDIDIVHVDRETGKASDGQNFRAINPNGYVPALVLDDGEILIEGPAIVQYLADLRPDAGLAPRSPAERRRIQSLLNFIATEIHTPMGQMFAPAYVPVKEVLLQRVAARLDWIATQVKGDFLTGDRFSVADAYLFACLNWSQWLGIGLSGWPELEQLMWRVGARPGVRKALEAEGLVLQPVDTFFAPASRPTRKPQGTTMINDSLGDAESIETETILRRFDQVFLTHDPADLQRLVADDCVLENTQPAPDGSRHEGKDACVAFWTKIATTPDIRFETERIIARGDRGTIQWRLVWGPDQSSSVRGINFICVRDGQIVEAQGYVKGA